MIEDTTNDMMFKGVSEDDHNSHIDKQNHDQPGHFGILYFLDKAMFQLNYLDINSIEVSYMKQEALLRET